MPVLGRYFAGTDRYFTGTDRYCAGLIIALLIQHIAHVQDAREHAEDVQLTLLVDACNHPRARDVTITESNGIAIRISRQHQSTRKACDTNCEAATYRVARKPRASLRSLRHRQHRRCTAPRPGSGRSTCPDCLQPEPRIGIIRISHGDVIGKYLPGLS